MGQKKVARVLSHCVACGCCEGICPLGAVKVKDGVIAVVDNKKCVGCGRCVKICPASVIFLEERKEADAEKEKMV